MYPGAPEVWYDGIDQDCGEDGDYDQDGDGADSAEYGGTDCDDTDPAIYYDSGETSQDLVDDDCDGLIDEDFIARGDVLIVEIMMTPLAVGDGVGEWFEVYNTSSMDVDLIGWEVRSWGNTGFIIDESLVVSSGSTVVLGVEDDASINGDLAVDYEFDRADVALNDSADTLFLYLGTDWITRVKWDESDGWELDDGASTNLDVDYRTTVGTGDAAYWCSSTTEFGDGDYGTPNATNDACTAKDYDGDGYSRDEGDCDDTDADTYPGAEEQWDGADNDCGGVVDDLVIDEVASGAVIAGGAP